MRALPTLLISSLIGCSSLFAHQDDAGDIHPLIRIEDRQFAVYFENTTEKQTYKTIVAADGKFISTRQKSQAPPHMIPPIPLAEELEGINVPSERAFYVFPEWERKHNGKPFMLRIVDKKVERIPLEWRDTFISMVHGAAISNEAIIFTASAKEPEKEGIDFPFTFHSFDPKSLKKLHSTDIGDPIRVYWFPRSSNVVIQKQNAYVAWMGWDGTESTLYVSCFNPLTGRCETRKICAGWGNSSPSIGVIDDTLLICFHRRVDRVAGDEASYLAEIAYEHRTLSTLFETKTTQADTGQPATRPESKSEGSNKLQPKAEGRSR